VEWATGHKLPPLSAKLKASVTSDYIEDADLPYYVENPSVNQFKSTPFYPWLAMFKTKTALTKTLKRVRQRRAKNPNPVLKLI
jgi:uncharacterized membrane protein